MLRTLSIGLLLAILSGCVASAPKFTPQQRRALQMRTFDATYDNVFRSVKTVFQDEGYIIRNQDFAGGMILAQKETATSGGAQFLAAFGGNKNYTTGKGFEVSLNLDKISDKNIETRMTLQSTSKTSLGGSSGREILKPEVYKSLYDKIIVEVQRRQARGL